MHDQGESPVRRDEPLAGLKFGPAAECIPCRGHGNVSANVAAPGALAVVWNPGYCVLPSAPTSVPNGLATVIRAPGVAPPTVSLAVVTPPSATVPLELAFPKPPRRADGRANCWVCVGRRPR